MMQEISDLERWASSNRLRPEEKERLQEYRRLLAKILVLPGFELTATFGFHVLGIFPPRTPIRSIEHVLLQLNVPYELLDAGETEVGPTVDVLTAYRVLNEAGALVIAAHANSSHGVAMFGLDIGGQTRIAYTQDSNLHALEVTDLDNSRRRSTASFFNGSKPQYPRRMHCIQASDAHAVNATRSTLGVGDRPTEVLIPEVSFAALKELFLSDDFARTRPAGKISEEPFDHVEAALKEGPTLVQSFHEQATRQGGRLNAVLRDVVGFANSNGGTAYIGVSARRKSQVTGVDRPDETMAELKTAIQRNITPPLEVTLGVLKSQGKNVVRVVVPKGDDPPYVLEGSKIYVRQESVTSLAMRDEIVNLIKRVIKRGAEQAAAPAVTIEQPHQARQQQPARQPAESPAAAQTSPKPAPKQPSADKPAEQPQQRQQQRRRPSAKAPQSKQSAANEPAPRQASARPAASLVSGSADHEPPRTGVEIVETVEREGVLYHTMHDLRNGNKVQNVSRSSARFLWRYAIALKEKETFQLDKVKWAGHLGLWHRYFRTGQPHYDLVQKDPEGNVRIYYGVTEDGIHGEWKAIVGMEE
jgi:pyridoxine/pyridoxamine 5'-phosphate oxidase